MKRTNEYKVVRGFDDDSYDFGHRFMLINNVLIDTKSKSISVVPLSDEELKELKQKLEIAVLTDSTICFEVDNYK